MSTFVFRRFSTSEPKCGAMLSRSPKIYLLIQLLLTSTTDIRTAIRGGSGKYALCRHHRIVCVRIVLRRYATFIQCVADDYSVPVTLQWRRMELTGIYRTNNGIFHQSKSKSQYRQCHTWHCITLLDIYNERTIYKKLYPTGVMKGDFLILQARKFSPLIISVCDT